MAKKKRIEEEAEAKRVAQEEEQLKKEAEAIKLIEEENRIKEKAEVERMAQEEGRLKKEDRKKNGFAGQNYQFGSSEEPTVRDEEKPKGPRVLLNNRFRKGILIVAIAIVGIWAFLVFTSDTEEEPSAPLQTEDTEKENPNPLTQPKLDSVARTGSLSKLHVGDIHDGGIVFMIDSAGKVGKMAFSKDVGPMPWKDAMQIHEQLGEGWRLPTMDELSIMYKNIGQGADNSGQFSDELYWSADSYDTFQARLLRFSDGNASYHYNKNVEHRKFQVRAVRDFGM